MKSEKTVEEYEEQEECIEEEGSSFIVGFRGGFEEVNSTFIVGLK